MNTTSPSTLLHNFNHPEVDKTRGTPKLHTPLPSHRLAQKVALITGGAGQIGLETAGRFLREGANVVLVDIDSAALEEAVESLKEGLYEGEISSSRILTITADATVEDDVKSYVQETLRTFKRLDVAFLNAGVSYAATSLFETSAEEYEMVMRVNVKSAFLGLKHCAAAMRDLGNGGSIILTSSVAGLRGYPDHIVYSASKFALRGLALTAANELGPYGIRVNTIHPSKVDAPHFGNAPHSEELAKMKKEVPLGRFAQVDDIAGVVSFLASDDSKFMTGGFLKVDGGSVCC